MKATEQYFHAALACSVPRHCFNFFSVLNFELTIARFVLGTLKRSSIDVRHLTTFLKVMLNMFNTKLSDLPSVVRFSSKRRCKSPRVNPYHADSQIREHSLKLTFFLNKHGYNSTSLLIHCVQSIMQQFPTSYISN